MVNIKKIIIAAAALISSLCYNSCIAGEIDVHLFGFSDHFDKNGAKTDAPQVYNIDFALNAPVLIHGGMQNVKIIFKIKTVVR